MLENEFKTIENILIELKENKRNFGVAVKKNKNNKNIKRDAVMFDTPGLMHEVLKYNTIQDIFKYMHICRGAVEQGIISNFKKRYRYCWYHDGREDVDVNGVPSNWLPHCYNNKKLIEVLEIGAPVDKCGIIYELCKTAPNYHRLRLCYNVPWNEAARYLYFGLQHIQTLSLMKIGVAPNRKAIEKEIQPLKEKYFVNSSYLKLEALHCEMYSDLMMLDAIHSLKNFTNLKEFHCSWCTYLHLEEKPINFLFGDSKKVDLGIDDDAKNSGVSEKLSVLCLEVEEQPYTNHLPDFKVNKNGILSLKIHGYSNTNEYLNFIKNLIQKFMKFEVSSKILIMDAFEREVLNDCLWPFLPDWNKNGGAIIDIWIPINTQEKYNIEELENLVESTDNFQKSYIGITTEPLEDLPVGCYFIKIVSNGGAFTHLYETNRLLMRSCLCCTIPLKADWFETWLEKKVCNLDYFSDY